MKKASRLAMLTLLAFFSSCINYEQVTTIQSDNSGEMYIHYWLKWNSSQDSLVLMNLEIFNQDSIYNKFTSHFTIITDLQVYKNFSDSTLHAKIEFEFNQFDSLKIMNVFKGRDFSIKDGPENTKLFSQSIPTYTTGWGSEKSDPSIIYIYYLPGEIIEHNADNLSNNKLTWKFDLNTGRKGNILKATYRPFKLKETPRWVYISALIVLMIVLFYLFRRKK